jgi:hypothetical protein
MSNILKSTVNNLPKSITKSVNIPIHNIGYNVTTMQKRGIKNSLVGVPTNILGDVNNLFNLFQKNIVTYSEEKTEERQINDSQNYEEIQKVLQKMEKEGRFSGKYSLNKKIWKDSDELNEWKKANINVWFDPISGKPSNKYKDGYIGAIPGDIISRAGVGGKLSPFEHWGIYIGEINEENNLIPIVLEINRIGKTNKADITITDIQSFIINPANPAYIISTIGKNTENGYIDNRAYNRQVSVWTALQSITVHWIYGIGINGVTGPDQSCQSYVNLLILGKAYTTQVWTIIYNAIYITGGVYIAFAQIIPLIKYLKFSKMKNKLCVSPCNINIISGNGTRKDCICESSCVRSLGSKKSWCYVNSKCGKNKGKPKYNNKYWDYCDNSNKQLSCELLKGWKKC